MNYIFPLLAVAITMACLCSTRWCGRTCVHPAAPMRFITGRIRA